MKERRETSLRSFMDSNQIDLTLFFRLAPKVVGLVREWHQHQSSFPRGVDPEHITLRLEGEDISLFWSPIDQEGTGLAYAYMSPEHGGRMMRQPDHRSDLYGIGILFYEWLTSEFPFQASSLNEWIHAHMAVLPKPLSASKPHIPQPINDLVRKLLAKAPEDRYQSAHGLLDDLRKCADQWTETGKIDAFPLGQLDEQSRLRLPSHLYGRDREWQQLLDVYARVCSGSKELIFMGGHAGSGKSTLMKALREPVFQNQGIFIYGKSESIQESKPYAPFIAALSDRIRHILASGDVQIELWKGKIANALGRSGNVLNQVIPELTWLIGEQPPVEALSPVEATNRFRKLFGTLIQTFASKQHPLVIGMDDLQWADSASIHLLRDLWDQSSLKHVMFIGTYREDEVGEQDGLHPWFQDLSVSGASGIHFMKLHALSYSDVIRYAADTLNADSDEIKPLADILYQQTAGNPLYLKQMLHTCHDLKRLSFNFEQMNWQWDLQAIKTMRGFQHVADLIRSRIETLPSETRQLLQQASCLGASFDMETISFLAGMDTEQLTHLLSPAVNEGWVVVEEQQIRFQHDQVQKVAYDLISDEEKQQVHLDIGRALLRSIPSAIAEERLFQIVHHMNTGRGYITDPTELEQLARMNLKAGRKAKSSAAYGQALHFLMIGAELVKAEGRSRSDGLYFQLVLERTECLYFSGDIGHAEADLRELLRHAYALSDRSRIYAIMIIMYSFHNRMNEAVDTAVLAMNEFGFSMPSATSSLSLLVEIARTQLALTRNHKRLDQLPINRDPNHQALAHIVTVASSVIFIVNPELSIVLFAKYVRLSLEQGLGDAFSIALGSYAAAIGFGLGRYRTAERLIDMAWAYAEQSDSLHLRCKVKLYLGLAKQYLHSKEEVVSQFEVAAKLSLECGDMVNAGYAISCHIITYDQDLRRLDQICKTYGAENAQWLDEITMRALHITERYIERLRQPSLDQPFLFQIPDIPENASWLEEEMTNEEKGNWYYLYTCKLEVAFLYNRYSDAVTLAEQSIGMKRDILLTIQQKHCFYYAMSLMRRYVDHDRYGTRKHGRTVRQLMNRMRVWTSASAKTLSKYRIMQAEYARLNRHYEKALRLYDQAIHDARQIGDSRDEAIAAESAAYVYAKMENSRLHESYLRKACEAYAKWGATEKAKRLQETAPALAELSFEEWDDPDKTDPATEGNLPTLNMLFGASLSQDLDIEMLQQTARTLMEDRSGRPLSERFLQLALHTTGAERGLILLESDGRFIIRTALEINRNRGESSEQAEPFSHAVIRFVHRTKESIILGEARKSIFASDPYIHHRQPRSILCLPIRDSVYRDGLLYLENNQTSDAFTTDRVDMLELLFSRMIYLKLWQLDDRTDEIDTQGDTKPSIAMVESLTQRELEIVRLMDEGLSNKQIALRLSITEGTVKAHANNIYGKLQVNRRVQAINKAKELRLLN